MKYIIEKDEMGIINYYNQDKQLVMQEYQIENYDIFLYYEDGKIIKVKANNLVLDLDFKGQILTADFKNEVTAYFSYKHQKIVFLDCDSEYLGFLKMTLEPIEGKSWLYVIKKIIVRLDETIPKLIEDKYESKLSNVNKQITNINDEMVEDVVAILNQKNLHDLNKILKDYQQKEIREKRKLLLKRQFISRENYQKKYQEITRKYRFKRRELKKCYGYYEEQEKLYNRQLNLQEKEEKLNELILEKKQINNEYLLRR